MRILRALAFQLLAIGKYGNNQINKKFGKTTQELCAFKLVFDFKTDSRGSELFEGNGNKIVSVKQEMGGVIPLISWGIWSYVSCFGNARPDSCAHTLLRKFLRSYCHS